MGKYTDPNAACATVVAKADNGNDVYCGHYVADHTWDDPWARTKEETYDPSDTPDQRVKKDEAFSARFNENIKNTDEAAKREEAALDRRNCHAYVGHGRPACPCKSYTDSTLSKKQREEAAAGDKTAEDKAMQARIDAAVAKALAERDQQQKTATPTAPTTPATPTTTKKSSKKVA